MKYQKCKICNINKELIKNNFQFGKNIKNNIIKLYWFKTCKLCDKNRVCSKSKRYKEKNRQKLSDKQKIYRLNNKEKYAKRSRYRYNNDPHFKLKCNLSIVIYRGLKKRNLSKDNKSFIKYLPYSIQELKKHLELQFEHWMNWSNWGKYNPKTWDDNDSSTWTWQIDHIVPHSTFKYFSMEDEEFKKCWNLNNLRPLKSKDNNLDGVKRTRHGE